MKKDLVVLVADAQQEKTVETLLRRRHAALGIREISFDILRHPRKDPGVFREAPAFLSSYCNRAEHALVCIDREWDGAPEHTDTLYRDIVERMVQSGWTSENCDAVVFDPELEIWLWVDSPHLEQVLRTDIHEIRRTGEALGYWVSGSMKPERPKELLEEILFKRNIPRSAAIYQAVAAKVSLKRCSDPSFVHLRSTLQGWFAVQREY